MNSSTLPKSFLVLITIVSLVFTNHLYSQQNDNQFWNHMRFGGGIGLSFGDSFFSGTIAPSAIYEFNPQFALGVGLNGTYNKRKDFYKSTILGGSLIGLVNPVDIIQLSAEFEELHVTRNWDERLGLENDNYWYPALFLGAGYRAQNIAIGIRYDVLYDEAKSIYANPWVPFVRVYF
ncbi:hypothetical protein OE09_2774 [Flavobacteriaceae bacterium MAR_2010_72]|nr:hypothetical protein OE09_2774 [Flavobacteriaceae bacterium MAR_2010_72]